MYAWLLKIIMSEFCCLKVTVNHKMQENGTSCERFALPSQWKIVALNHITQFDALQYRYSTVCVYF